MIQTYSKLLNTPAFPAHITIRHSIHNRGEAKKILDRYKFELNAHECKPSFSASGNPVINKVSIYNSYRTEEVIFHSIEQPLSMNGKPIDGVHLSLAYKIGGEAFTPIELGHIETMPCIFPENVTPVLYSCFSKNPSEWVLINE
jgi:hypothetical protein